MTSKTQTALGIATAILTFAGAVAGATVWFAKRFSDVDARMQKLEQAVKALNITEPDEKYRELVKQLLAQQAKPEAKSVPHRFEGYPTYPADAGISGSASPAKKPD